MSNLTFEKDFSNHPLHYFVLLSIMLIGLWGIFWFNYYRPLQLAILVSMAIAYIIWGIVHHVQHKDLHPKIIFEYVLVSVLVVLIFASLLLHS